MLRKNVRSRIVSLVLAVMMLVTSAVPAFAMGYDDLQTVIDMTGGATSSGSSTMPAYILPQRTGVPLTALSRRGSIPPMAIW